MRFLVTGGAGFIGSALCRYLVTGLRQSVVNVDSLTYASTLTSLASIAQDPLYSFVQGDIRDAAAMSDIFRQFEPDAVLHLAAESHVDRSIDRPQAFLDTNVMGTASLLDVTRSYLDHMGAKKSTFRFVHVSTDEVYGSLGPENRFDEDSPYNPSSPYSASKASADHLVSAWHKTYGVPTIISNCSNNYGPFHFPEKLIPLTILNALDQTDLPIYGDGLNIRDWLYVEDHVRALHLLAVQGEVGRKYNVRGSNEHSNLDVVDRICALMDSLSPSGAPHARLKRFVKDRPAHDFRYAVDATRIKTELGWAARENFETGIEKTVRWYLERRDWWKPLRGRIYRGERLGLLAPMRELKRDSATTEDT